MSPRAVLFKLTAEPDESLRQVVTQFGQTVGSIYEAIYESSAQLTTGLTTQLNEHAEEAKKAVTDIASVRAALDDAQAEKEQQHTETVVGELEKRVAAAKDATDKIGALSELQASFELQKRADANAKIAALENEKVTLAEATAEAIKAMNDELDALESSTGQSIDPNIRNMALQKILVEGKAAIDDIEDQITKNKEKEAARRQKIDKGVVDAALKEELRKQGSIEKAEADRVESAVAAAAKLESANRRVLQALAEVGESVMRVARGFVAMGLVGEKDLDKVKDALLTIQSVSDLFSGSLQIYLKITRALEAMRDATIAAAAAQKVLAAAQAQSAASGAASAALGGGVAGAAAKGSIAGAAGSWAAGAAGTAGATLAGTVLPVAALGTAVIGTADLVRGGGQFKEGSISHSASTYGNDFGGWADTQLGWDTDYSRAYKSKQLTERREKERAAFVERTAREDAQIGGVAGGMYSGLTQTRSMEDRRLEQLNFGDEGPAKVKRITEEIAAEEARIADLKKKAGEQDERFAAVRDAQVQAAVDGEERVLTLMAKRRQVEAEIGRQKVEDAQHAVHESEKELHLAEQKVKAAESAMMSAKERFGLLSDEEQATAVEQAKRLKSGEKLEPEDLRKLQGLGLESVNNAVKTQASERAAAAGFDEIAAEDSKRLEELKKTQADLEVTVNDKRQIVVKIEQDTKAIVDGITKQMLEKQAEKEKELRDEIDKMDAKYNELKQRVAAGGGRA